MSASVAAAAVINWAVTLILFAVGLRYFVAKQLMTHHLEILGTSWTDLTPPTRALLLTLMKGTGLVGICTAVSLAVLLAVPFRRGESWSRWAILLVGATALVPLLIGAISIHSQTGASSKWWPHVALLAALGSAFWLSRDLGRIGS